MDSAHNDEVIMRFCSLVWMSSAWLLCSSLVTAQETKWQWSAEALQPFWQGATVYGESVLFLKDPEAETADAVVLFPINQIVSIKSSAGDITYEEGRDYLWKPGSHELLLTKESRIPSFLPSELRRQPGTQPYALTHRDGNGEILFGGRLEYAAMQVCVTYEHGPISWNGPLPKFDATVLPRTIEKLKSKQPVSLVVLGDSISAGANASAMYDAAPYQPAYPELVRLNLAKQFETEVTLTNLSVGGKDTPWGVTQVPAVLAAQPDLIVIAFGMNDSAGRPAKEYQEFTRQMLEQIRKDRPETEFILVASMLGNADWTRLKQELFPAYRDALAELCGPGIALADVTAIWTEFLKRKLDCDQTGNGVNHPNDFGHRVYAQVISALLIPE
ncbi:SGNH/GDSL hydrolase family protein [bacterium]|nr:SGNH/GDSL hydrolase family protein [bacterium]